MLIVSTVIGSLVWVTRLSFVILLLQAIESGMNANAWGEKAALIQFPIVPV
jgi:hypothetical protein